MVLTAQQQESKKYVLTSGRNGALSLYPGIASALEVAVDAGLHIARYSPTEREVFEQPVSGHELTDVIAVYLYDATLPTAQEVKEGRVPGIYKEQDLILEVPVPNILINHYDWATIASDMRDALQQDEHHTVYERNPPSKIAINMHYQSPDSREEYEATITERYKNRNKVGDIDRLEDLIEAVPFKAYFLNIDRMDRKVPVEYDASKGHEPRGLQLYDGEKPTREMMIQLPSLYMGRYGELIFYVPEGHKMQHNYDWEAITAIMKKALDQ